MDFLENIYNTAEMAAKESDTESAEATEEADATDAAEETDSDEDEGGIKEFAGMIKITSASVEKNGVEFGDPEIQEMFDYNQYISDYYTQMYGGSY